MPAAVTGKGLAERAGEEPCPHHLLLLGEWLVADWQVEGKISQIEQSPTFLLSAVETAGGTHLPVLGLLAPRVRTFPWLPPVLASAPLPGQLCCPFLSCSTHQSLQTACTHSSHPGVFAPHGLTRSSPCPASSHRPLLCTVVHGPLLFPFASLSAPCLHLISWILSLLA